MVKYFGKKNYLDSMDVKINMILNRYIRFTSISIDTNSSTPRKTFGLSKFSEVQLGISRLKNFTLISVE